MAVKRAIPRAFVARFTMRKQFKKSSGTKPASFKPSGSKKWKAARGGDAPPPKLKKGPGKPSFSDSPKPPKKKDSSDKRFSESPRPAERPYEPRAKGSEEPSYDSFVPKQKKKAEPKEARAPREPKHAPIEEPTFEAAEPMEVRIEEHEAAPKVRAAKPTIDNPGFEKTTRERPVFDKPARDKPAYEKPAYDKLSYESSEPKKRTPRAEEPRYDRVEEEKPKARKSKPVEEAELLTFFDLGLEPNIAQGVINMGFESPTPIQAKAIPVLLRGGDMIGQAQTGTGKTAAFALPLIERIDATSMETQAIVLAPTRELAVQVAGGIYDISKHLGLRVVPVYGGQPIDRQFRALKSGAHIVVGTPGRVLDHLRRGSLSIANVKVAVLDEADEMLALGFTEDLEAILAELPESRQLVFFSATMPARIMSLTRKFLRDPVHIKIESKQRTLDTTNQTYYEVPNGKKLDALARVLDMETPGPTIVFCRTRQETNDLSENLRLRGYLTEALHGDMNQAERDRTMRKFRDGQADLLIATDVAARGLDIDTVTHVINYDIPFDVEQYIHRIGRTGRAGRTGDAITLVTSRERNKLRSIERLIGSTIKPARIPTPADIAAKRRDNFQDSIRETLSKGNFESHLPLVADLADDFETVEIAAAALQMLWELQHASKSEPVDPGAQDYEQPESGMTRIFVGMGRQDGLRPGDLVGCITNEAGLPGNKIGVIDVLDRNSFVEVPAESAEAVLEVLRNTKIRHRKVTVQIARGPGAGAGAFSGDDDRPRRR
jgi:ATP-dependent RNA helicase DeaD